MAWTNIFDLADWDLYVRTTSTFIPTPNSRGFLVPISELDPAVGTVTVENGEIVCDINDLATSGGIGILVCAMPSGTPPPDSPFRATALSEEGNPILVPDIEGEGGAFLRGVESLSTEGTNEYAEIAAFIDELVDGTPIEQVVASQPCLSGQGVALQINYPGI